MARGFPDCAKDKPHQTPLFYRNNLLIKPLFIPFSSLSYVNTCLFFLPFFLSSFLLFSPAVWPDESSAHGRCSELVVTAFETRCCFLQIGKSRRVFYCTDIRGLARFNLWRSSRICGESDRSPGSFLRCILKLTVCDWWKGIYMYIYAHFYSMRVPV